MFESKRKRRALETDARKLAVRKALEQQYKLNEGELDPKPVPHLGRFMFFRKGELKRYQSAMSRKKAPPAK